MLRKVIRNGFARRDTQNEEWSYLITNNQLLDICKTEDIKSHVNKLRQRYLAHVIRLPDDSLTKRLAFNNEKITKPGRQINYITGTIGDESIHEFARRAKMRIV